MRSLFSVMVAMTMLRSCGKKERLLGSILLNLKVKYLSIVGFEAGRRGDRELISRILYLVDFTNLVGLVS